MYADLGLKIGLEVHQQLNTKHKLFCKCSGGLKEKNLEVTFERRIRPVVGELGEIDAATAFEGLRNRVFVYHGYENEHCLICEDEEPPMAVNQEALNMALRVAAVLRLDIPDELHVMRKNVSDGSVVSSYQRSIICGLESGDSYIQTSGGPVKINTLALEEDACKIIRTDGSRVYYSLSRQGIPLIEIQTNPDIVSPKQAKEVAEKIGQILRSFPETRRGIGTIRQDVNLSIRGGARVEIKGFQDLKTMQGVIEHEIKRQAELIKKGQDVKNEVRKANADGTTTFLRPMPGSARMYPDTDEIPVRVTREILKTLDGQKVELLEDRIKMIEKLGLTHDLAVKIAKDKMQMFMEFVKYRNIKPAFIASLLVSYESDLPKKYGRLDTSRITRGHFESIFSELDRGEIAKDSVGDMLAEIAKGHEPDFKKYKVSPEIDIEKEIEKLVRDNKDLSFGALMGIVMGKYKGKVPGEKVAQILKEKMK